MKRETAPYVSECDTCRKVNADYMKPRELLQPFSIPYWKWEDLNMDFIVGLPMTVRKFNSIWVVIDRFNTSTHFIPMHTRFTIEKYGEIYIACILCLHGVPKMIVSDQAS
jgi:hypothetical protein